MILKHFIKICHTRILIYKIEIGIVFTLLKYLQFRIVRAVVTNIHTRTTKYN